MELQINNEFAKHYNSYRAKEEAAKTKKVLKNQIKQLEESSSSSDSEYEECYKMKYIEQCDNVLRKIESLGKLQSKLDAPLYDEIVVDVTKGKIDKPLYAKDLNRQIILDGGVDNEKELMDIEKYSKLESEDILNMVQSEGLKLEFDNCAVSDDDDFLKPSKKPAMVFPQSVGKEEVDEVDSDIESNDEEEIPKEPISAKIEINRDRRLDTVRVSKTTSRAEKRKVRKEKKEKELKEKMKRLQELKKANLNEKLDKIKKNAPEMAKHLTIEDLDGDFDIDEYSKKLAAIYEQENADLPVDKEKPVFSDDSDIDFGTAGDDDHLSDCEEEAPSNVVRKGVTKEKPSNKVVSTKKNASYFTKIDLPEEEGKKKVGILRKVGEAFDREKHRNYNSYFKKAFDICCEDLILGKDDDDDIKCCFRYRKVEEQTFGLDVEDIILADNKELNSWASLKKITRIRTAADEEKDRRKYSHEAMQERKREILASLYKEESDNDDCEVKPEVPLESEKADESRSKSSKKRLRKLANKRQLKEGINVAEESLGNADVAEPVEQVNDNPAEEVGLKRKSKKKKNGESTEEAVVDSELPVSSKKKHDQAEDVEVNKKSKKRKNTESVQEAVENSEIPVAGKKEKHKKQKTDEGNIGEVVDNCNTESKKKSKKDKHNNTPKAKKNKSKGNQVPVLNANRLESLGIKPGYYKHVLCSTTE